MAAEWTYLWTVGVCLDSVAPAVIYTAAPMTEQRTGTDRRGPGRPKGGRRASDPIDDLATHKAQLLTVGQLADYWGKHVVTIGRYIRQGRLKAATIGGEYRVKVTDALAFERVHPASERRPHEGV